MSQLTLSLLGPFQAVLNGAPLTGFRTQKVQALLIILTAEPQTAHRREQLMTLLWPGMPEPSARANLRQVLFHLRQVIPDFDAATPLLIANRHTIQLNPEAAITVDVAQFSALLTQAQRHEHIDLLTCHACYQMLQTAVTLYRSDFLADFYLDDSNEFEEWAQITRQRCRRNMLDALDSLTTIATRRAAYAEARTYAEQQLAIDNLQESAYRQLMEILALSGQRAAALAVYESCRRLLMEELGMAPTAQTTRLYEKIQAGELSLDQPAVPGVRGYELKEEIGAGAYGVIHRAVQPAIGREVAVKIIHPRYANDPTFIRRFEMEAQTIARLEHPHIVPLYDYWREPGGAYLVMRLLRGGNLLTRLQSGPWSPTQTRAFLDQIAAALHIAHQQGIVHRDIKPGNILFDEGDNAYLADFGIAKDLAQERPLTNPGDIVGTLDYISPEQLQAGEVTPQSDIYSLGAVLYEMLTGEKPFANQPLVTVIQSHLSAPFPLVSASQPGLPAAIDEVIQRATAKRPQDRFPSALALAEMFAGAVDGRTHPTLSPIPSLPDADIPNPYKGLRAYQEADAHDFYGRETLIAQLTNRLADGRFLAIVGPSGSGKSSVVKAGLIPALRQSALPDSDTWYIAQMTPGTHPLEELELALWPIAVNPPPSLVEPMQKDSRGMLRTIRRILPEGENSQLLLVIDQFEELFTMTDASRRTQFLESLYTAVTAARSPLRVVVTLRADFYDRPLQYQPLADLFKQHTELVLALNRDELIWAIQEPARRVGVGFEDGLLADIVADMQTQPGALPLLQYALTELFNARQGRQMTRQAYATIGGVPGALARRADEIFHTLTSQQQTAARQMFLRLVTPGADEGAPDTRRRVRLSELEGLMVIGDQVSVIGAENQLPNTDYRSPITDYGSARLLTFDRDPLTREPTVEVAHEALLHRWERLRGWIAQSRADMRQQRQLASLAAEWESHNRDDGFLLREARLTQFEAWQMQNTLALLPAETAFLQASLSARAEREAAETARQQRELETAQQLAASEKQRAETEREAAQRLRRRAVWLAGALALAVILALAALFLGQQAQQNAAVAARSAAESQSIALAAGAQAAQANNNGDLALALALAANEIEPAPAFARRVLYDAALSPGTVRQIVTDGGWRWSLDVSKDGRLVAAGDDFGDVTIWDVAIGQQVQHLAGEHGDAIGDVAFTPDGRYLLSSAYDDQLILWDVATGAVIWRALNPTGDPNLLNISPDGSLAAAGTEEGVVTLWDMASGKLVGELAGHDPAWQVLPVVFSSDGRWLASGSETGEVILWDVHTQSLRRHIQVIDDVLFSLAFSPDGQTLAAAGKSGSIWLFDADTGALVGELPGLPDWVFAVTFSPNGSKLLAGSRDGAVLVWDVASQQRQQTLYGEEGWPLNVAFVDENTAVASYNNGNLRVWDLADGRQLQSHLAPGFMPSFAQSADGRLAVAGLNNAIQLLDLTTGETHHTLTLGDATSLEENNVTALAFDPSGAQLLSGSGDGRLILWDVASGEMIRPLPGHTGFIHQVAFSPDGRTMVSTADDRQVIGWDSQSGEVLFTYINPTDVVTAVSFSPDGRLLALGVGTTRYVADFAYTEQRDTRVLLLETATGEIVGELRGHTGPVTAVTFSDDGRYLLSGALDATLRLWDVADLRLLRRFDGHTSGIMAAAFNQDGAYAASGAQDGTVIIWDVATGDLLRQIPVHVGVVHHVAFNTDGNISSAAEDGGIYLWHSALDDDVLRTWLTTHRHVPPLACLQQIQYGLVADCSDD